MEKNKKKSKKKGRRNWVSIIGIVVIALVVLLAFHTLFTKITRYRMLEEKCRAIENSPDLLFPCKCKPLLKNAGNESDTIYRKTQPMCVCTCEIGNNRTVTIEVRAA